MRLHVGMFHHSRCMTNTKPENAPTLSVVEWHIYVSVPSLTGRSKAIDTPRHFLYHYHLAPQHFVSIDV